MKRRDLNADSYLRERELREHIPLSHSTLWREVAEGRFPAPIKLTARATAWRWGDVIAWLDERRGSS
jgi:predicted DNA-binding transcriptional regulator AlpA